MAAAKIRRPVLVQQHGNMNTQRPPVLDNAPTDTFVAGDLVYIDPTSKKLKLIPTTPDALQVAWGQTPDGSHLSTDIPPVAFFGQNHYCFDLTNAIIEMSTTDEAGSGAPPLSQVIIGSLRGIFTPTTGTYLGVQMVKIDLLPTQVTWTLVQIVGIAPNQSLADTNGRVLVKIINTKLQS